MPMRLNNVRRLKRFRRQLRCHKSAALFGMLLLVAAVAYAGYMSNQRLIVNPASYQDLLHLIGRAESNDNYNAYFGNAGNSAVEFTDMTIAEVLVWQHEYVREGSPSSAVGRYQIITTTLEELVRVLDVSHEQKFDTAMQDQMAIALLERRGAVEYVNRELSRQEFAANLAKEWAALPRAVGNHPEASYYAGDGLNKSRVEVFEVLQAIEPISAL